MSQKLIRTHLTIVCSTDICLFELWKTFFSVRPHQIKKVLFNMGVETGEIDINGTVIDLEF